MVLYYYLLNPLDYTMTLMVGDTPLFQWITASIPSLLVTAVVYWILTRFVIIPLKKGGYA
jgi:NCS1 family nucleobase:cation symporter-1